MLESQRALDWIMHDVDKTTVVCHSVFPSQEHYS